MSLALRLGSLMLFLGIAGWGYLLMAQVQRAHTRMEQACELIEILLQQVDRVLMEGAPTGEIPVVETRPQQQVDVVGGLRRGRHHAA